jgi:hypothetical protein
MRTTRIFTCFGFLALLACATEKAAISEPKTFNVSMKTEGCPASGPNAMGAATVTIAVDGSSVTATVTYSGLSGDPTAAHIHSGVPGVAGPVVLPFSAPLTSPFSKTFTATDYVAAAGAPPDFAAFVTALRGGGTAYVNVHTAACKPGEIRGDIQ